MTVGGICRRTCKDIPVEIELGFKISCELIKMGLLKVNKENLIHDECYCWIISDENFKPEEIVL